MKSIEHSMKQKFEQIKSEIDQLLRDDENRKQVTAQNSDFFTDLFQKYLHQKLLIFLIHDGQGTFLKVLTEQAISKKTLEGMTPYLRDRDQIVFQEDLQLAFINLPVISENPVRQYSLVFDLEDYWLESKRVGQEFDFLLVILGVLLLLLSTLFFWISFFRSQRGSLWRSTEDRRGHQHVVGSLDVTDKAVTIEESRKKIQLFFLKRNLLDIIPLYPSVREDLDKNKKKIRQKKKIDQLDQFYENKFQTTFFYQMTLSYLIKEVSLSKFLQKSLDLVTKNYPHSVLFYLERKRNGHFMATCFSPGKLEPDLISQIKLAPEIGEEKKYFNSFLPYREAFSGYNDDILLSFPLLLSDRRREFLIKVILPKKGLDDQLINLIHRWSILLACGVEHFKNFNRSKVEIGDWFNKEYFMHLLDTYFKSLSKVISSSDQPDKIIKLMIKKKSVPYFETGLMNQLKDRLDLYYAQEKIVFGLQNETQTIWALTFLGSDPPQSFEAGEQKIEQELSQIIKEGLAELMSLDRKTIKITTQVLLFPQSLDEWQKLKDNQFFWKSSLSH